MKTVSGKLVSTKPISLSNAAKYISRFVSSDNGASQAVSVYLQRTSDSFNGLVQFRKKLKGSHSRRKEQVSQLLEVVAKVETLGTADGNPPGKRMKNSESKGKGKKNQEFELKKDVPLEIEQVKAVSNQVDVRESLEIKGEDEKNQIFEVKFEETMQNEENSGGVAEKKKKKKSGKDKVPKDGTAIIEHPANVVSEIEWDKNFKSKSHRNHKFDVKNEQTLQIEQTAAGVVEEKNKKKSRIQEGKNEEAVHVQIVFDGVGADENVIDEGAEKSAEKNVIDEGAEKSEQKVAPVEGSSAKREKKKKRKRVEVAEVKERSKGIDGKKATIVDGGETIDLSEQSGNKNVSKSDAFDKTEQGIMEHEGDTKGAEGVSLKRDKTKKRKKSECKLKEEGVGGEGVQKENNREVDAGQAVDLADQSKQKKWSKADVNDEIKQCNVEVKDEGYPVGEGIVEMRSKKNKNKKSEGEEAEKSFWGEEGKNVKSKEVDSGETVYLAEQMQKNRGSEADGNDNMEVIREMDRVEESTSGIKDEKKRKKTTGESEKSLWGEKGKKMKRKWVADGVTVDLTERIGKKTKRRKIEAEGK